MTDTGSGPRERPGESAHSYGLKLLAMRAYSVRDLGRKLERRGYPAGEVAETVASFTESGLLDDVRFAAQYARSRIVNDSAAPRRVVQLLGRYGVPRTLAEQAVARTIEEEELNPADSAELLARKKAATLTGLELAVARRRLYGYLARRGFDLEHIRGAVASALADR
ncbi:MAG TPA: regulatory protein RecX [Gemmatimonadaceae bacterium]